MSSDDEWSPDEALGTETFRQGDVAEDEGERIAPSFREALEQDPSIDPSLVADELELRSWGRSSTTPSSSSPWRVGSTTRTGSTPPARGAIPWSTGMGLERPPRRPTRRTSEDGDVEAEPTPG